MIFLTIAIVLILTPGHILTQNNDDVNNAIIDFNVEDIATGKYNFRFGTDNIEREESGGFSDDGQYVVSGFYSYIDNTGRKYIIRYIADKEGYHPVVMKTSETKLPVQRPSVGFSYPGTVVASMLG